MLIAACIVLLLVGIVHSWLGERLIFRHLRQNGLIPTRDAAPLRQRHIRILWATWHIASVFGWGMAAVLWQLAVTPVATDVAVFLQSAIAIAALVSSTLVFVATRARHPGWVGLLVVSALILFHQPN